MTSLAQLEITDGTPVTHLYEMAQGVPRREVMRQVAGPAIAKLISPIYSEPIDDAEAAGIAPVDKVKDLTYFSDGLVGITLEHRLRQSRQNNAALYENLDVLSSRMPQLFFNGPSIGKVLREGLASGVVVPLLLAGHILKAEHVYEDKGQAIFDNKFKHKNTIKVMQRDNFLKMLQSLTKGPNGFLGLESTNHFYAHRNFFGFKAQDKINNPPLTTSDAFKIHRNKVVGFSDMFYLAANAKRRHIYAMCKGSEHVFNPSDSSGCPVGRAIKGDGNETVAWSISESRDFVISALKVSAAKA
jgi:hypothetical protein